MGPLKFSSRYLYFSPSHLSITHMKVKALFQQDKKFHNLSLMFDLVVKYNNFDDCHDREREMEQKVELVKNKACS